MHGHNLPELEEQVEELLNEGWVVVTAGAVANIGWFFTITKG